MGPFCGLEEVHFRSKRPTGLSNGVIFMSDANDIIERARNYLTSGWSAGKNSTRSSTKVSPEMVFDHSLRVLETGKCLLRDSEVSKTSLDPMVLTASAMFHDSGWIDLVKTGQIQGVEIFTRPADLELIKRSAQIAADQLGPLLPPSTLKRVSQIIIDLKQPRPNFPETRVLADADNLEDFGLLGITTQVRAAHAFGKSVRQVIESWHRQQEYNYWEARIKSALHLETSRKIARRRLETMGKVFHLLHQETTLEDLETDVIFSESAVNNPTLVTG
jgi:HD superfamily phosphodiesterase